jgi:hypothetical protein
MRDRSPLERRLAVTALVAAAALTGHAWAQPADRLDLSRLASRFDTGQAWRDAGVARTSLDRSLRPGAAASVGLLCGLQPSSQASGGASALGVDHDGRFLGAQLRFGFR